MGNKPSTCRVIEVDNIEYHLSHCETITSISTLIPIQTQRFTGSSILFNTTVNKSTSVNPRPAATQIQTPSTIWSHLRSWSFPNLLC